MHIAGGFSEWWKHNLWSQVNLQSLSLFSHSVMSDSLPPHGLQYARLPCSSPFPGACSNSCSLSWWCHQTILSLSSVVPFSSCLQCFPPCRSFPVSQFFSTGGQNIGASVSASDLPMNTQGWFSLGLTGLISLQSKGLSITLIDSYLHEWFWLLLTLMIF